MNILLLSISLVVLTFSFQAGSTAPFLNSPKAYIAKAKLHNCAYKKADVKMAFRLCQSQIRAISNLDPAPTADRVAEWVVEAWEENRPMNSNPDRYVKQNSRQDQLKFVNEVYDSLFPSVLTLKHIDESRPVETL